MADLAKTELPDGPAVFEAIVEAQSLLLAIDRAINRSHDGRALGTSINPDTTTSAIDQLIGRLKGQAALKYPHDARRARVGRSQVGRHGGWA